MSTAMGPIAVPAPRRRPRVVYVAGPFRASRAWLIEQNVRRAESQVRRLLELGFAPVCMHTTGRFLFGEVSETKMLDASLELVRRCDAVLLLEGYEQSAGAVSELNAAIDADVPTFHTLAELREWDERTEWSELERWEKP